MAKPDRKGGGGLSLRTLAIASAASLSAAMVTARLFPPGTIYASALTPVIVAAVSEMLNRPVDRVTQLRRQRRTLIMESREFEAARIYGEGTSPWAGASELAPGAAADEELYPTNGGGQPPITIHGRRRGVRRILHPKVWIATGLAAFAIAVAVLTVPELIFGGAVATTDRTTFFGGGSGSSAKTRTTTTTQTAPTTVTETVPAQTPTATHTTTGAATQTTTSTGTATQTTPTTTTQTTAPGASTSPAPGAGVPPAP